MHTLSGHERLAGLAVVGVGCLLLACDKRSALAAGDGGVADLAPDWPGTGEARPRDVGWDVAAAPDAADAAETGRIETPAETAAGRDQAPEGTPDGPPTDVASPPAERPWPAERPDLPEVAAFGDGPGPSFAAPSGGCVSAVVTPSLAFRGTVGLDFDEDGVADDEDDCPWLATSSHGDVDGDGLGDACDRCAGGPDLDHDGVCDDQDNCPRDWNPSQYDIDGDGIGNRCDSRGCSAQQGSEQIQPVVHALLRRADLAAELADSHWRVGSAQSYCSGTSPGMRLGIIDYSHRREITVSYLIATDELVSLKVTEMSNLLGPQPSAEEGREAAYLAERDPQVRAVLDGLTNLISAGAFFYEFGTTPADNDPAFPTCTTGRCIDVLYMGSGPDGNSASYSAVVEMDACEVLGIKQRG